MPGSHETASTSAQDTNPKRQRGNEITRIIHARVAEFVRIPEHCVTWSGTLTSSATTIQRRLMTQENPHGWRGPLSNLRGTDKDSIWMLDLLRKRIRGIATPSVGIILA